MCLRWTAYVVAVTAAPPTLRPHDGRSRLEEAHMAKKSKKDKKDKKSKSKNKK